MDSIGDILKYDNPHQVTLTKLSDDKLGVEILHEDKVHNFTIDVQEDEMQNIETFGEEMGYMIKTTILDISHKVTDNVKHKSTEINMKWNHSGKPSVFEISKNKEILYSGPFSDAMNWISQNVI